MANVNILMRKKNADGTYDSIYPVAGSCIGNSATATTASACTGNSVSATSATNATTAGSCTGNSATATILATSRTISISGGATGTATNFNGSANIIIPITSLDATKLVGLAPINITGSSSSCTGNSATAGTATYALYSNHAVGSMNLAVRNIAEQTVVPSSGSDGDICHVYS